MSIRTWAHVVFGGADLGDNRRTRRLVAMARQAARNPGGRITQVFPVAADRQAAYDFLEHDTVRSARVAETVFDSTARASDSHEVVVVPLDGTSLTLTDSSGHKGFGHVGALKQGACGMKVINALALDENGVPLGVADQVWWSRQGRARHDIYRPAAHRESVHWREVVAHVVDRYSRYAPNTRLHFLADREGDASFLIRALLATGHDFTIRSNATRRVVIGGQRRDMRSTLRRYPPIASLTVQVPARANRAAREAHLEIRAAVLSVGLRDSQLKSGVIRPMTVLWAREPRQKEGLDWVLLTSARVRTANDARRSVQRYCLRWRIEDFHRAWKSGACCVEETQLRTPAAVIKWATILAAVASRAEQLKHRARAEPDALASTEFSDDEIEAIAYFADEMGKAMDATLLTIGAAVRVVAEIGGFVGAKSSGPPGTSTITRGLEKVLMAADVFAKLRTSGRLR